MATLDDILGAAQAPAKAPTLDDILGPQSRIEDGPASTGEAVANYIANSPVGHILDAFGQGVDQGWGTEPVGLSPETEKNLRDWGAFQDYQKGEFNIGKSINETLFRPAATAVEAGFRGMRAVIGGGLAAIEQTGKEAGAPRLGREAAAVGEYMTQRADVFAPSMATLAKARDLGVIGEGEAGWKGTAEQTAAFEEARKRFAPSQDIAEAKEATQETGAAPAGEPQPGVPQATTAPPDIHATARQIDPETFREYDALTQRKETFARWIDELGNSRDAAATADLDKQIAEQQARLEGATGKKAATYQSRIEDLTEQRDAVLEQARGGDSPDMARIRQQLQQTDYRMRDLAPDVTAAYQRARSAMPTEQGAPEAVAPSEPAAPAATEAQPAPITAPEPTAPAATPVAPGVAQKAPVDIAADVAQKLTAAGRPAEEANAVSALYAARYEARAARLGTTAQDLYGKQPLNVEAGGRGRKGEMGRTVLKDGRATIRLMGNADTSTFMHETGHQWLEELTGDAKDERATPQTKQDAQTVRDWLGNDGGAITTGQHEKFARGFERYLMEGRAPTQALAGVFGQFKDWLTKIYETVTKLRSPITDDIRDVFDRLIAKNPDRDTVVAPEREAPKSVVARHNELAETTPREQARSVAEQVKAETDRILSAKAPEIADEVAGRKSGTSGGKGSGAEADGDRPPPGPDTGATGGGTGRRGIDAGGSEAAPQGDGGGTAIAERVRTEPPAGPHDALPEPESRLVDRAGNIRLDNLNTPADVSQVLRETADANGGFTGARRGSISDSQVLDLADALGMDAKSLSRRKLGQAFNAEQVVAARKLLIQSATAVRDAAAAAAEGADKAVIDFAAMLDRHRMIQEQVSGVTAEAGRALRAFRALEGSKEAAEVSGLVSEMTGRTLFQIRQTAARMAQLDTTAKVSKFAHDSGRSGVFDWLQSLFINALISGPFTHAGYTAAGEIYGLFRATAETGASALVGKVRQLTGLGEAERAHISEMPAQLYGMYSGAKSGLKASWQAWKANQAQLPAEVIEAQKANPKLQVAGQSVAPHSAIPNPKIAGVTVPVGTVIGSPGRLVAALHSFNWTTFYTQSKAGQASRIAEAEGLKGGAFVDRIVQLTQTPTDAMIKEAIMDANSGALLQRPAYDSLMGMVSRLTNYGIHVPDVPLPGGKSIPMGTLRPLKYIDPFVQIQANIQRTAFGRGTPLALFSSEVRDNLAMKNGGAAFDRQAGRLLAGTSFMIAAGSLAAEGLMNWSGPDDRNEQARFQQLHGLPHGLRIGDFSYDMLRLGNLGLQMSVAADLYHAGDRLGKDDIAKVGSDLVHAFSQNIIDESSLHGPSQLLRAVEEHDRYGASYVRQFLTSFMPFSVGMSQIARQVDPYSRQARTTMDAFKAKIPVVSEGLEPRYDIWGQPVLNRGWALTYYQRITNDPVDRAFERVGEQLGVKFYPSPVEPKIRGVTLTDHQYADYSRIAGRMAKMRLDQIVQQPGFETLPAQTQHDMMAATVTSSRETARSLIMMQNPNIITDATKAKVARLTGAK